MAGVGGQEIFHPYPFFSDTGIHGGGCGSFVCDGEVAIKTARNALRVPRSALTPVALLNCVAGSFAVNNSVFDVGVMFVFRLLA